MQATTSLLRRPAGFLAGAALLLTALLALLIASPITVRQPVRLPPGFRRRDDRRELSAALAGPT
mgnify:CR=1 FL=1